MSASAALLFISICSANAQFSNKIRKFTSDLKIDTFLLYSPTCYHEIEFKASEYRPGIARVPPAQPVQVVIDTCFYDDPQYIFWKAGGKSFMKHFERCNDFEAVELGNDDPLAFYLDNKELLGKEKIEVFLRVDHKCSYYFSFYNKGQTLGYGTTEYAFYMGSGALKNSAYEFNMNTRFKALLDKVQLLISP